MSRIIIRPAAEADLAPLARVNLNAWRAAYRGIMPAEGLAALTLAEFEAVWDENLAAAHRRNLVAAVNGDIAGFVSFGPTRDDGADHTVGEIMGLYLDSAYWNQGIGRALCDEALASMRQDGFEEVTLWVLRENARARRFYELAGFILEEGAHMSVSRWDVDLPHIRYRRRLVGRS
jgi:ribosomal protein S18 acetylase RimI-like enzyme